MSSAVAQPSPAPPDDSRPLSPAQIALFETPHLANVERPQTLRYTYRQVGPDGFEDTIGLRVYAINSDGTKDLAFEYLTGPHRVGFPGVTHFRGNPLLMLVLERDVTGMHAAAGLSASYFRNRIREAFVDAASVAETTAERDGRTVTAREITVQPFAKEARLAQAAGLQAKIYRFTLIDAVPGMIEQIRIETPADPAGGGPARSEQITFAGVEP